MSVKQRLKFLYPGKVEEIYPRIQNLVESFKTSEARSYPWVGKEDVVLITYGDAFRREGEAPLKTLLEFMDVVLEGYVNNVHILPMFPYTSDDGFSVSDFKAVDPQLGGWDDIRALDEKYSLMFDAVINHASVSCEYFKEFIKGTEKYRDFFLTGDPDEDYSMVTRPRTHPLLTRFESPVGTKYVWTTFSEDQADFNFKDPEVLIEILGILLLYASKGARFIRFDAIGFAWKEAGTTCMHLPQTHELVKLMREVIEECFKGVSIITETNVPHKDNISYFGNGHDEAGLVYQFPLPPLTLHAYLTGNASKLSSWADSLEPTTEDTTFFNFLASHDGIGVRPVEGILEKEEVQSIIDEVQKRGGQIGWRTLPDGSQTAYELNINYLDAIAGDESDLETMARKFMGSQCILLSFVGMPAIYYHSILGSRNSYRDFEESGIKRRINRAKLDFDLLKRELDDKTSLRRIVLDSYKKLIAIRKVQPAFDPNRTQRTLFLDYRVFALIRGDKESILVLVNVSRDELVLETDYSGTDLIEGSEINRSIRLLPYQYRWIRLSEPAMQVRTEE
ncbi:sugar phosphorylase [Youngiibacter multivorans]|uniref:Sucrose 6(F)-phosphate phosphorylase n=1 Tax=Youngiibacter multivorans TaxID=937251 RepID=A0ABS4G485_9CLOT|nr:sugar phosphorylase [Youngiibacter multivorans]MBP1919346.1 sucrose phosphorylase [Youngiibacter multivorans]